MATRPTFDTLSQIKDPVLQKTLKRLLDRLNQLEAQVPTIGKVTQPLDTHLNSGGQRLTAVADYQALTDAVNVQSMQGYVGAAIRDALVTAGVATITGTPVPGPGTPSGDSPTPTPNGPWPIPQSGIGSVRITGNAFTLGQGGPLWPWRGCTDFRLYQRYLDGENIAPILANRVASGANVLRVLGMMYNITNFYPVNYPNYFSALPAFAALLQASGLWLEFVLLADCQFGPVGLTTTSLQIAHTNQVYSALAGVPNVFIELANEYSNNGVDPSKFGRPNQMLSCAGWGSPTGDVFIPPWDYVTIHTDRGSEWMRKSKDIQDVRDGPFGIPPAAYAIGVNRPVVADEPMGAGDTNIPGRRDTNPDNFYWYGAGCQLFGVGGTFHSDEGIQSVVFNPVQQACANAFFSGMAAVPPDAQLWSYTRGPFPDCPLQHSDVLALRTYAKINGNTAVVLVIRPTGGWVPLTQAGWSITSAVGPGGTLLYCSHP